MRRAENAAAHANGRITQMCRRCCLTAYISCIYIYIRIKQKQLSVSHFSFSSRYFYNKTIVPRFFGFMWRNLAAVACSSARLLSTPHYSRRPIVYVKIDGRTHNRDARRGQLSSFYSARPPPPLSATYARIIQRWWREGTQPKFATFLSCRARERDKFFDFSTSTAAIVVSFNRTLICTAPRYNNEKNI